MDIFNKVIAKHLPNKTEQARIRSEIDEFIENLEKVMKKQEILGEVMLGGSAAKGTFLIKDFDVDVFVRITEEGLNDGINEGEIIIISNDRVNPEFRIPVEVTTGNNVEFTTNPLDRDYTLSAPYPNPFNNTTQVHFSIPRSGLFTLAIFDLSGREMAGIYDGYLTAGNHQIEVQSGNLTAGVYILKSMFENEQSNHKVVLIK